MAKRRLRDGARVLRDKLKEVGLSRCGLERRLGLSAGTAYRWADGSAKPDITSAILLERALGIPVEIWADSKRLAAFCTE